MTDYQTLDREVRLFIYNHFVQQGRAPDVGWTAAGLNLRPDLVEASYQRLTASHVIVLQPSTLDIWMAMPFSAVPTDFRVTVGKQSWWANCAWDAFGIAAMLHADALIETHDPTNGTSMELRVQDGTVLPTGFIAHFDVPTAEWWNDIGYT